MSMRSGSWQIILADLSLILFVTTLAGLDQIDQRTLAASSGIRHTSAIAPGQALFRDAPDAMPFREWLDLEGSDPRARLSIELRYPPGGEAEAWRRASKLAAEARAAGADPRLVLEQGRAFEALASFAYDDLRLADEPANQAQTTRSRPSSFAR